MRLLVWVTLMFTFQSIFAQEEVKEENNHLQNGVSEILESRDKVTVGGYGQVDFNKDLSGNKRSNGELDVHRMVILFGYKFNTKTQFVTEIEFEHVSEVFVEQAFLNYSFSSLLNFRAGLLLIPMGIINEYHESSTFNGVERPNLDNTIVPTTWREIGAGFTGRIQSASIKYQAYLLNGFNGFDGSAKFNGSGLRSGRQKGAESFISSPNFAGKVDYFGIKGVNLGLSAYLGKSQSELYDGIDKTDKGALQTADSSVIGISMIGFDTRYRHGAFQARGQYYYNSIANTQAYNEFTGSDLGSAMQGYYLEAGYNVFRFLSSAKTELIPFIRFEQYNTQQAVAAGTIPNKANSKTEYTFGLGWKVSEGAMFKLDFQLLGNEATTIFEKQLNAGIGVAF
ncbi:hypothetical protein ACFLRI_02265 [Bacteroidota bacterium]